MARGAGRTIPRESHRAAVIMFAAEVSAVAASIRARGQTDDVVGRPGGLAWPDIGPRQDFPERRRCDLLPSPSPWSAAPALGAGSSPGGVITRLRARRSEGAYGPGGRSAIRAFSARCF